MKLVLKAFSHVAAQARRDCMLLLCWFAPLLMGAAFRFGLPAADQLLLEQFSFSLSPYFLLFDLLFAAMTPVLLCFAPMMILLEEIDNHISSYLAATPLGKWGYLFSRLGVPIAGSAAVTFFLCLLFFLTPVSPGMLLLLSAASAFEGAVISLVVVCLSSNQLEGMTVVKLSGLLLLGIPAPFLLAGPLRFLFLPLPRYWIAQAALHNSPLCALASLLVSTVWIVPLFQKFQKKLS